MLQVLYATDLGEELDHALLRVVHFFKDCEALMHQVLIADVLMTRLNIVHHLSFVTELEHVARVHMETKRLLTAAGEIDSGCVHARAHSVQHLVAQSSCD